MKRSICTLTLGALLGGLNSTQHTNSAQLVSTASCVPAHLVFGDYDIDGFPDALAIASTGELRLLRNLGNGTFADVSAYSGLGSVRGASVVLWQDFDGDQLPDLFVGTDRGPRHLFRNLGNGSFADVTERNGHRGEGCDMAAHWLDYDGDTRLDLHLETAAGGKIFHALPDGGFEELVLPRLAGGVGPLLDEVVDVSNPSSSKLADGLSGPGSGEQSPGDRGVGGHTREPGLPVSRRAAFVGSQPGQLPGEPQPLLASCLNSIRDQANPGVCLQATSVPTAGKLFPGPHLGGVNNLQSGTNSFVGGGQNNQATNGTGYGHTTVGGGRNNIGAGNYATVGGGRGNAAAGPSSTIAGGKNGMASGYYSTVGGGNANNASGPYGAVAGGAFNAATGSQSAAVGGGQQNTASGSFATVAGGAVNTASTTYATVSGGGANNASGYFATVGGGGFNTAAGGYSFAAGRRAKANHSGAFVWGDSQNVDKTSSSVDEFNIYASGGARIFSNAAATTGVLLAAGGGSWSSVSDRESKENFERVESREVLARVCALSISTWNYKAQDDSIRHMGPMAQDFHSAFGLGVSEKTIDTIDPDGVALAAIQGLDARMSDVVGAMDGELRKLREANAALEARVARLESFEIDLASLKARLGSPVLSR